MAWVLLLVPAATAQTTAATASDGLALCDTFHNQQTAAVKTNSLTNWCSGSAPYDPCSTTRGKWAGVTCATVGGESRVVSLDLSIKDIRGSLPTTIGNLGALTYLDLSYNSLSSFIPSQLGLLTNLQELYLSSNKFTSALPTTIGSLEALTYLDLSSNSLSSSIPSELGLLTKLQYLNLGRNQFNSALPTTIGILGALEVLNVWNNRLSSSIPSQLGLLTKLQKLDLSYNDFASALPTTIGSLGALTYLDLSVNSLSSSIPSQLGLLTNLHELYLSSNEFNSALPTTIGSLGALTSLGLGEDCLKTLPTSIGLLTALQYLDLQKNSLTALPTSISQLTALNELNLASNKFRGPVPDVLCLLPPKAYIVLSLPKSGNNFTCLPECLVGKNVAGVSVLPDGICKTARPTIAPTVSPTGYSTDRPLQSSLSTFSVSQSFACEGEALACSSVGTYAQLVAKVNALLWVAYADRETPWLTSEMLERGLSLSFRPDVGSYSRGYLVTYAVVFRPSDLKMSTMQAVQSSFRRAVDSFGYEAYSAALTAARRAAENNGVTALNCTSISVGDATLAPPALAAAASSAPSLLSITVSAQVALGVVSGVAVLYAAAVFFLRLGVQRSSSAAEGAAELKLVAFKHFEVLLPLTLSIMAAASNVLLIKTYLGSPSTLAVAAVMILCRVGVALYSAALLLVCFARPSYNKLLVAPLLHKALVWALVALAALLDTTHLRFLPWKSSEFAERSRGFPKLRLFKLATGCTAANALLQLSVSCSTEMTFTAIASLVLSLVLFASTVFTISIKLVAEKIQQHDEEDMNSAALPAKVAALEAEIEQLRVENKQLRSDNPEKQPQLPRSAASSISTPPIAPAAATRRVTAVIDLSDVYNPALDDLQSGRLSAIEMANFRDNIPPNTAHVASTVNASV